MQEFEDSLTILIRQLDISIKHEDIKDIAQSLDINKDGFIDFNEFLEAFRIVDNFGKDKTAKLSRVETIEEEDITDLKTSPTFSPKRFLFGSDIIKKSKTATTGSGTKTDKTAITNC